MPMVANMIRDELGLNPHLSDLIWLSPRAAITATNWKRNGW